MGETASETRQYYLGIAGEQTGPLTEEALLEKIRNGAVPEDTLIWFDGIEDWQPITSFSPFKDAFTQRVEGQASALQILRNDDGRTIPAQASETRTIPIVSENTSSENDGPPVSEVSRSPTQRHLEQGERLSDVVPTFAPKDSPVVPVFDGREAVFSRPSFLQGQMVWLLGGVSFLVLIFGGIFYWWAVSSPSDNQNTQLSPEAVAKPQASPRKLRELKFRKALSELVQSPTESLRLLNEVITANPNDDLGREAVQTVVAFYRRMRNPLEAARTLMSAKHPEEASKLFLAAEPPAFSEAERAYFEAFQGSTDPTKKQESLTEDVRLLLGPLNNSALAIERIKILEKGFPGYRHPFSYYLKPTPDRINDLFSRISFFFVQSLVSFIDSEFPHINLKGRPIVEVKRDKEGNYRIEGNYKGDVTLQQDRLSNIFLVFWLRGDQWYLVDTNLTPDRKKWASVERKRLKANRFSDLDMLKYLEQVFKSQFPRNSLHEKVTASKSKEEKGAAD